MGFNLLKAVGGFAKGFVTGGPLAGLQQGVSSGFGARKPQIARPAYPFEAGPFRFGTPVFPPGQQNISYVTQPGQNKSLEPAPTGGGCPTGFRLNKSTYVTRGGGTSRWPTQLSVHPKGSTCVRRRKINAGNGRAATRAVHRLVAFYRLSQRVAKQLRRAAVKAHVGGGRRGQRRLPSGSGVQVIDTG